MADEISVYDVVGGMAYFEDLVDRFYEGVASDPPLLALYPEPGDLTAARHRLTLFLAQYWGGPTTYSEERGHPALRMRHAPFAIGADARDRWLSHMRDAVATTDPPEPARTMLLEYLEMAAGSLVNHAG